MAMPPDVKGLYKRPSETCRAFDNIGLFGCKFHEFVQNRILQESNKPGKQILLCLTKCKAKPCQILMNYARSTRVNLNLSRSVASRLDVRRCCPGGNGQRRSRR